MKLLNSLKDQTPLPRTVSVLEDGRQKGFHLGAQLHISRHGQTLADRAWGEHRPGAPMQRDTLMLWRSATKPIVAVAIAMLVERDKLKLSDPVARWIPEFAAHGKNSIRLEHLLTHTAGMRSADLSLQEDMPWDAALRAILDAKPEPRTEPGAQAGYHLNSSWYVLGELIRRLDGRNCAQFVREEIFEPLQMTDCWIGMDAARYRNYGDRIGIMHVRQNGALRPHPFADSEKACALCQPGSNGRGPMRELGKFYEHLLAARLNGERKGGFLVSPETVRYWTSRRREGMNDQTFRHVIDWGYGFIIDSNRHGPESVPYGYGRHCSEETFGHSGSQSSCAFADPALGLVVAWVCNGMPGEPAHQTRARELNTAIYEDLGLA